MAGHHGRWLKRPAMFNRPRLEQLVQMNWIDSRVHLVHTESFVWATEKIANIIFVTKELSPRVPTDVDTV